MVCFVEGVLAEVKKMVVTLSNAANETNKHIPKKLDLFSFGGEGCEDEIILFLCSYHVPQVLNAFHNNVPNRASIYPKSFAQSSPLLHCIGGAKGEALHPHREIVILGSLQFFLADGPIKVTNSKKI
jgi:hypothetical protein